MAESSGEKAGGIYYEVSLDTRSMLSQQRDVTRALDRSTESLGGFHSRLTQVAQAVGAYTAALFAISQSDAFTKLEAQIKLASRSNADFLAGMESVKAIAKEAQADISGVATLYARLSTASQEMGMSQQRVADITRVVALSLKVSGATAAETASATLQLSQAFATGVLRGEEFNSVSEAGPRFMKALADGIGRPIGELRAMAEAGQLTTQVLASALPKALGELENEARQIQTISGAFQQLKNEVMLFVGEGAKASGAARATADAIGALADNLDLLAAAAMGYAVTQLSRLFLDVSTSAAVKSRAILETVAAMQASRVAAIANTKSTLDQVAATQAAIVVARADYTAKLAQANAALQAANAQIVAAKSAGAMSAAIALVREGEIAATAATKARSAAIAELAILGQQQARVTAAMTAAQSAHTAALTATGTAATFASRALGFLGGPIGAITTLLGLGATAWMVWGSAAGDGEKKAAEAVERSHTDIVKALDEQIAKLKERNKLVAAGLQGVGAQDTEATLQLASLQTKIDNLKAGKGPNGGAPLPEAARVGLLQDLLRQYGELAGKVREVDELKAGAPNEKARKAEIDYLKRYGTAAQKAKIAIDELRESGVVLTPEREKTIRDSFKDKDAKGNKFDAGSYLSNLSASASSDEKKRVRAQETEALADVSRRAKEGLLTEGQAAEARKSIRAKAANDIAAIEEKIEAQTNEMRLAVMRDGEAKIEAVRVESIRKINEAEKTGALNAEQAALSRQKAEQDAGNARADLAERNARAEAEARIAVAKDEEEKIRLIRDEAIRQAQAGYQRGTLTATEAATKRVEAEARAQEQIQQIKNKREAAKVDAAKIRASLPRATVEDKVAALKAQAELELDVLKDAMEADLVASATYSAKKLAIQQKLAADIEAVKQAEKLAIIGSAQQTFSTLADVLKAAGKEQSTAYKVMFAASKAFAIAESIVNIQAALAKAANAPFPKNLAQMAIVAANTANIISTIQSVKYGGGRQYGGAVSSDKMYRVNENGRPEMFTAANGRQYMLPNTRGEVTPADKVGGGGVVQWNIVINNMASGVQASATVDNNTKTVEIAVNEVASQISNNSGPVWQAMRSSTNIEGRL